MLIAPSCAACDAPLLHPTSEIVCEGCWRAVERLTPPLCLRCGDTLASWRTASVASGLCARCRRHRGPWSLDHQRAAVRYDGRLRDIVQAWKYGRRRSLSRPLARLVADAAGDLPVAIDAVVPVPLHRARRLERGFNQAADLARGLGLPVIDALHRVRSTPPQVGRTAAARRRNVRGAFALAPLSPWVSMGEAWAHGSLRVAMSRRARRRAMGARLAGRRLLLVDDVSTTGATLEACAAVLRAAGAASVVAVTAARAVRGPRR